MDKLFNLFKEFMPLLEHYPAWVKYLFGITLLFVLSSLFLFVILFPSASAKKKTEQTAAVINFAVSLLDDTQAKASGVSLGPECRRVLEHEQDRNEVTVRHILSQDGGQIEPFCPYLSRILRGDPITPLLEPYQSCIEWCPPNLDLRVVNNSDKSILFHTVIFEVEKSSKDYAPLIVMEDDELWRKACHILLANEGWGKIQNCSLRFNLAPIKKDQARWGHVVGQLLDNISFQGPFRHSVNIADFETFTYVNLTTAFINEGVKLDAKRIAREVTEHSGLPESDHEPTQKDLGKFSSGSGLVYGVLEFTPFPGTQNQTVKFAAIVHLYNSGLSGAAMPSSFQYHTEFQVENQNYQVSLPVSHNLKPGEADRFNIRVVAPQSSTHKFRVKLLYNQNDSVISEPMKMRILVPRSVSQRLKHVPDRENK